MTLILTDARKKGDLIREDCNEINLLETDDAKQAKLEMWIAKKIGEAVHKQYPGREWAVQVDLFGQVVILQAPALSKRCGWHIHMMRKSIHDLCVEAQVRAGEILERFGISRAQNFDDTIVDALPRNTQDDVIAPDAKPEPLLKTYA